MSDEEKERVVIRDNRKIDPVTGEARKRSTAPADGAPAPEVGEGPNVDTALLDERTRDLQRVQAEYANYRKRADRDRLAAGDVAVGRALAELLPIVDDLDRARTHGDLTGALKAVADKLEGVFAKLGVVAFGQVGDQFDPAIHEAVLHDESDAVTVPTCTTVMRQGYQHRGRLLRAAMVGVTDPIHFAPSADAAPSTVEDVVSTDEVVETIPAEGGPSDEPAETETHGEPPGATGTGGPQGDALGEAVQAAAEPKHDGPSAAG